MAPSKCKKVEAVMSYYALEARRGEEEFLHWTSKRRRFNLKRANEFFVGVMLDQGQKAERAWEGAEHLVQNYFTGRRGLWKEIIRSHPKTVNKICTSGYHGKSYASVYCTNKFPAWLRDAARHMLDKYEGDPRTIWAVTPDNVDVIYHRFLEFPGIGDALAKMAQFILVRNYGVAGGRRNQSKMAVKPDLLVRRVLFRAGLATSDRLADTLSYLAEAKLARPADFDAAAWLIGRNFCTKKNPKCGTCPVRSVCAQRSL